MKGICKYLPRLGVVLASTFAVSGGAFAQDAGKVAQDAEEECEWVDGECIEGYVFAAEYMSVEELKKLMDAGSDDIVVVDTSAELIYQDERIPGSINFPWVHEVKPPINLPRDKTLVLYCACVGEEDSLDLAQKLSFAGFTNTKVLEGGWFRWLELGYPTVGKAVGGG
jgi:rhodanese-related sulfurtransferase